MVFFCLFVRYFVLWEVNCYVSRVGMWIIKFLVNCILMLFFRVNGVIEVMRVLVVRYGFFTFEGWGFEEFFFSFLYLRIGK